MRGWRWVQISKNDILRENAADIAALCPWVHELPDWRGYIIGAVHFSHAVDSNDAQLDAPRLKPWVKGPKCSVVTAALRLEVPVKVKGTVNPNEPMPADVVEKLQDQLEAP